ncbi:uncharacterized protein LOC132931328 [Rhopalosiphum padi]|uniref:uncharacterized protein LOC132931328 n=1 Tax=Rhopalosiphum padi TaxID=40932 RepID=UPI00298DA09C|nr:uncharacterized protein LOC132931328 [Rhopalosiphum padi]
MNTKPQSTATTTPLQQAAELLERTQQLLKVATAEAAAHATTAARVRRMSTAELRRDPVLWAAYTRGWDDRTSVFRKATDVGPTPAVTDRSRSPRRHVQPAGTPRPPPMPQSARLIRPPPQPLMAAPVPRPRTSTKPPAPITDEAKTAKPKTVTPMSSRQRRSIARKRKFVDKKKPADPTSSQQFRLEKPASTTPEPATCPRSLEATDKPVPETEAPEVVIPTGQAEATEQPATDSPKPADMEISPDEEAELLCDMDVGPPDDVDMETVFQN